MGERAFAYADAQLRDSNALKYTPQGHVSLTFAAHDAQRWVMRIADTGPGLAPEAAERLFGGFPKGGEVVPRRGIGLACCPSGQAKKSEKRPGTLHRSVR